MCDGCAHTAHTARSRHGQPSAQALIEEQRLPRARHAEGCAVYMIAEKAADVMLADASQKRA